MAIEQTEQQYQWSGANSVSIAAGGNDTTDVITHNTDVVQAKFQLKASNDGTPAAGDTIDFWFLESMGDPDGASTDEHATREQGQHLATLDTNDDDPASAVVSLPGPLHKSQIYAVNNSGGRAVTVSAICLEQRVT